MSIKLSIVIPVYNVEKYLKRCIESIIIQNSSLIELILVDDGSTDGSDKICDEYAGRYENIFSYHKTNGGLSDARNYGIEKSHGEYLWFIDSDDYIENDCLKKIIEIIDSFKSDVIVIKSKTVNDKNEIQDECIYSINEGLYSRDEYMKKLKENPKSVIFCAQYHLCNKEFITKNNILFLKGIIHEDELWTPQVLLNSKKVYYSNLDIYFHYMRSDSIMHSLKNEKSGNCNLIIAKQLFKIFKNYSDIDIDYLKDRTVNIFLQAVWKIPDFIKDNNDRYKRTILKNSYYIKTKIKALLYFISPSFYIKLHNLIK